MTMELGHFVNGIGAVDASGRVCNVSIPSTGDAQGKVVLASTKKVSKVIDAVARPSQGWLVSNPQRRKRMMLNSHLLSERMWRISLDVYLPNMQKFCLMREVKFRVRS